MLPYINYGLMVWGFSCNRVIKLQKKAIRIICLINYNAHTEPLFKKLKILNVTDMLKLHELKQYYKYVHTTLPVYLQNLPFILNKAIHTFNTRIHGNIHTNRAKHDFAKRCIRHDIPLLINNTTFNIKNKITTHSLRGCISYAKENFLQNFKTLCFYQTVKYVDIHNKQRTNLQRFSSLYTSVNVHILSTVIIIIC